MSGGLGTEAEHRLGWGAYGCLGLFCRGPREAFWRMKTPPWEALVNSSFYYDARAEEVLVIADQTNDQWCAQMLVAISEDYRRLAEQRRQIEAQRAQLAVPIETAESPSPRLRDGGLGDGSFDDFETGG